MYMEGEENSVDRHRAAEVIGCSPDTITRLIQAGRIKAGDVGLGRNKHYRITMEELRRFQADAAVLPSAAPARRRGRKRKPLAVGLA